MRRRIRPESEVLLDSSLGLAEGVTKEQVLAEMGKHNKIAEGQIMGLYSLQGNDASKPNASPAEI